MDEADRVAGLSPDFAVVLEQLATALHRIQLRQLVPDFSGDETEREVLDALAGEVDPEDVQVWYQFALQGRRDLQLAPDVRSGFEMTLLRMLAFRGVEAAGNGGNAKRMSQAAHANARPATVASATTAPRAETRAADHAAPARPRVAGLPEVHPKHQQHAAGRALH